MKKILISTLCLFGLYVNSIADMIQVGEELVYEVSFLTIKLGTIKIVTLPDTTINEEKVYHSKVFIQSNPSIPFYSLKTIFNSYMDTSLAEGKYFECNSKEGDQEWGFQKITFKDKNVNNNLHNEKWYAKEKINDTIYQDAGKVVDGSTLFFYARKNSNLVKNIKMPTLMDLSIGSTILRFTGKQEKINIDAIKEPINTYYIEGKGEWKALYGLGDKFQGWFSADDAKVPIKAKMNVYIGSINIELKSWKRVGWTLPK
jgi:hypothetical protein